jgi:hypothetical protein
LLGIVDEGANVDEILTSHVLAERRKSELDSLDLQLVSFTVDRDELTANLYFLNLLVQLRS